MPTHRTHSRHDDEGGCEDVTWMRRADFVTGLLLVCVSVYLIWDVGTMKYLVDGVPSTGFWPILVAIMICGLLLMLLCGASRGRSDIAWKPVLTWDFWHNSAIAIGGSTLAMPLVQFISMLAEIGILIGFLPCAVGAKSYKTNMAPAMLSPVFLTGFRKSAGCEIASRPSEVLSI